MRLLRLWAVTALFAISACASEDLPTVPDSGDGASQQYRDGQLQLCGNGSVDPGESCDTAITSGQGSCPLACNDDEACTADSLEGSGCTAKCIYSPISTCDAEASDGCCPANCTEETDADCAALTCGNGKLDPGERCDTAIAAGEIGGCPARCDDGTACTTDNVVGSGCEAYCQYTLVTACSGQIADGCCPAGCTNTTDTDCSATCGDGVLDDNELCDTAIVSGRGVCPTASDCDDKNACTADALIGAGCNIRCHNPAITSCDKVTSDRCCPAGCTHIDDLDCKPSCGNGVLDDGEKCDPAITSGPGTCPTAADCDDGRACTIDSVTSPGTCTATCSHTERSECILKQADGCCPVGCTSLNDADCSPSCGNGALEGSERCDTAIASGQTGACPASASDCNDNNACTTDWISGGGCSAQCAHTKIETCSGKVADGCCPAGCLHATDIDCPAGCGDGVVQSDEQCDTAIAAGQPGACPVRCSDGDACTSDALVGSGCTASCPFAAIKECLHADGCCPAGCNANTDSDCKPVCGNAIWEQKAGELCDIKIPSGQSGTCPTKCDDGKACTTDALLNPNTCSARCEYTAVQKCLSGDGCCPAGCDANSDTDCKPVCGNAIWEQKAGELCDIKIPSGQSGACPQSCPANTSCVSYQLISPDTCQAACQRTEVTTCALKPDKCCPTSCTPANDADCCLNARCGDRDGCCPAGCTAANDGDCGSCTGKEVCGLLDGCCGPTCTFKTDADCLDCSLAVCGAKDGCCPPKCVFDADC